MEGLVFSEYFHKDNVEPKERILLFVPPENIAPEYRDKAPLIKKAKK